jgi:hypothetical protein
MQGSGHLPVTVQRPGLGDLRPLATQRYGIAHQEERVPDEADRPATGPLVALSGDPYDMRDCQVTSTEAGELVLAGSANAIELNGIDDWVLGVHVDSRQGSVWYRKGSTLVSA